MTENGPQPDGLIPSGATIGRYVVLGHIARGAMGEVYAAHDPTLGRKVAIKLVRIERTVDAGDSEGRARFMREAQAIAKLSHPNVVIVHDVGQFADRVFIAMEFIEGRTLTGWLHAQPRTWRDILKVFIAAGRGLLHAHEANLVHRDFKPENVMVRVDGEVRVMDFGLVRHVGAEEATTSPDSAPVAAAADRGKGALDSTVDLAQPFRAPTDSDGRADSQDRLTETGVLMGTPAYMSPEQFRGKAVDARSDQFSFCVALYEALYGLRPFEGPTVTALAINVLSGQIIPPPERSPVPVMIWQALRRGLSVDPAGRYPSMNELLADLGRDPDPLPTSAPSEGLSISAAHLASLLEMLLGRAVHARPLDAKTALGRGAVASYAGPDGVAAALVHFDLPAAAGIAAALTALPAEAVEQAVSAGRLPQNLMDNLLEVANVLTTLVRGTGSARLRIQQVFSLPGGVPPIIRAALAGPPHAVGFDVSVADYPGGQITVVGLKTKTPAISREQTIPLRGALVVDDSGAMRLVIGRALARLGVHAVLEASNGEQGLKTLREGAAVEAVFVDWSMPVMDGLTFIKAVRAERRFDRVRLVMVTTEGDPAQMDAARAAGADEYLIKPISDQMLRNKLKGIGLETT